MLACKGIFATPSIVAVLERAREIVSSWGFYEINPVCNNYITIFSILQSFSNRKILCRTAQDF